MKRKLAMVLACLSMLAGLLFVAPAAEGVTLSGTVVQPYEYCAPGQVCGYNSLDHLNMSCVRNDDAANSNTAIGVGVGTFPVNTYQLLLLRHWIYCSGVSANRPQTFVVGNGYCMRWVRFVSTFYTTGGMSIFDVQVDYGYVQGSALPGNVFRLNRLRGSNYSVAAYLC